MGLIYEIMNIVFGRKENGDYTPQPISGGDFTEEDYDGDWGVNLPDVDDDIESAVHKYSKQYNVPFPLLLAIIKTESDFRRNAIREEPAFRKRYIDNNPNYRELDEESKRFLSCSHGLTQLMGLTAVELGFSFSGPQEIYDVNNNIMICAYYLRKLWNKYNDLEKAVASYNAGSPRYNMDGSFVNQNYVSKVLKYFEIYKQQTIAQG